MDNLIELFCDVDDFCNLFIPEWEARLINNGEIKRRRVKRMALSTYLLGSIKADKICLNLNFEYN